MNGQLFAARAPSHVECRHGPRVHFQHCTREVFSLYPGTVQILRECRRPDNLCGTDPSENMDVVDSQLNEATTSGFFQ